MSLRQQVWMAITIPLTFYWVGRAVQESNSWWALFYLGEAAMFTLLIIGRLLDLRRDRIV